MYRYESRYIDRLVRYAGEPITFSEVTASEKWFNPGSMERSDVSGRENTQEGMGENRFF